MPASLSFIAGLAILRISVAILHVLPTMDPDYTRTSTQPVSLRNHDEKPLEEICRRKYAFYCPCSVFEGKACASRRKGSLNEDTLSWRAHFQNPICVVVQNHTARKSNCARRSTIFSTLGHTITTLCVWNQHFELKIRWDAIVVWNLSLSVL